MDKNIGKQLREENLAKFNKDVGDSMLPSMSGFKEQFATDAATENAGRSFSQDAIFKSPFKNDHFNSKLLGFDLGPVMDHQYDENGYNNPLNTEIDFEKMRADNQSAVSKIGSMGAQFVGKTVIGTAGNIVGTFYGIGEGLLNSDKTVGESIFDNKFTREMDAYTQSVEDKNTIFVNHKDGIGLNFSTAKHINDAFSFIASAVAAEAIMQTAGNAVGGLGAGTAVARMLQNGKRVKQIMKAFDSAADVEKHLIKMKGLGKTVEEMAQLKSSFDKIESVTNSVLGTGRRLLTTTGYESSMEARGVKDEFIADHAEELEYQIAKSGMSEEEAMEYRVTKMAEIEKNANTAGLTTFLMNTALLSASNAMQFPQIFGSSTVKQASLGRLVNKGIGEIGRKSGKGAAALEYTKLAGRVFKNPATEFMEETLQGVAGKFSKNYFEMSLGTRSDGGVLAPKANSIAESMTHAVKETYGTSEGLQEGIIGAIVGAIGIPGMKKHGKGRKFAMQGGVWGSIQEEQSRRKEEQAAMASINKTPMSETVAYNKDNAILASLDTQKNDMAILTGNTTEIESVRDNKVFRYTVDRLEKGMGEFVDQDIAEMRKLANNNLEEYKTLFDKPETFTKEEALKEVEDFEKKTQIYTDAYNLVHKNFNDRLMRSDDVTRKLTDTLTYAVATEELFSKKSDTLKNKILELSNGELNAQEIQEFLDTSGIVAKHDDLIQEHIKSRTTRTPSSIEAGIIKQQEMKQQWPGETGYLLDMSKEELTKQLEFHTGKGETTMVADINKALKVKDKYDALLDKKFHANKSSIIAKMKKDKAAESKTLAEKINEQAKALQSKAMNEISKPVREITSKEVDKYMSTKERIIALLNKKNDTKTVYERAEDDATAEEFMAELHEVTDRHVTAANVAAYLYGFKNSPVEVYNKIKRAQFFQDIDNVGKMVANLDHLMTSGVADEHFATEYQEFAEVLAHVHEVSEDILGKIPPAMDAILKQELKRFDDADEKYRKFLDITSKREEMENAAKEAAKKEEKSRAGKIIQKVGKTVDDVVGKMLGKNNNLKTDTDEENDDGDSKNPTKNSEPKTTATGAEGNPKTGSPQTKAAKAREIKDNRLTIREQSNSSKLTGFDKLINDGKFKDKQAVTIDIDPETNFDPDNNTYLESMLMDDDLSTPYTFATSKSQAKANNTKFKAINFSDINMELSGFNDWSAEDIDAVESITVLEQKGRNEQGHAFGIVDILRKDGKTLMTEVFFNAQEGTLMESYNRGKSKLEADRLKAKDDRTQLQPKNPAELDPDVYTFIRYAPMQINAYDKVLSAKDKYAFEIEKDDKVMYNQYLFKGDDILAMSAMEARATETFEREKEKLEQARAKELEEVKKNDDHKSRVNEKYRHAIEKAEAKKDAFFNNPHTNFRFRFRVLKDWMYKDQGQLKLKIQSVDQGNLQNYLYEFNDNVEEFPLSDLGIKNTDIGVNDIYYTDSKGIYRRAADKEYASNLDNNPLTHMNKSGVTGTMVYLAEDQTGKKFPIKLNTTRFDKKHIDMMYDVTEAFFNAPDQEGFRVTNSGIPFLDKQALSYEDFMEFFLRKLQGNSIHAMWLRNTFNVIKKDDGSHEVQFALGKGDAIAIRDAKDMTPELKTEFASQMKNNRFAVNTKFLFKGEKGAEEVNQTVMDYYTDNGIINHSFDVAKNYDTFYSKTDSLGKPYNKGITLSIHNTEDSIPTYAKSPGIGAVIADLRDEMGTTYGGYETNMVSVADDSIHGIVMSMRKLKKKIQDADPAKTKFSTEELDAIFQHGVDTAIGKKIKLVEDAIAKKPHMLSPTKDHHKNFKIKPTDKDLDKFYRMVFALKEHASTNKSFRTSVFKEYELMGAKKDLVDKFKERVPGSTVPISRYMSKEARNSNTPTFQIGTQKQFDALKTLAMTIKELTQKGTYLDVNYAMDYQKNPKEKPRPYDYIDRASEPRPNDLGATKGHFATKILGVEESEEPVQFDPDTKQLIGGKITFVMQTLKTKKNKDGVEYKVRGKDRVVFLAGEDTDFPIQNFITSIALPYLSPDYTVQMDELKSDIKKMKDRAGSRTLNKVKTAEKVIESLGEDFLKGGVKDSDKRSADDLMTQNSTVTAEQLEEEEGDKVKPTDTSVLPKVEPVTRKRLDLNDYMQRDLLMRMNTLVKAAVMDELKPGSYNKATVLKMATETLKITSADGLMEVYEYLMSKQKEDGQPAIAPNTLEDMVSFAEDLFDEEVTDCSGSKGSIDHDAAPF